MSKLKKAARQTGIKQIAIGGGVSANSALQKAVHEEAERIRLESIYPPARFFARQCRNGCRDGVLQISGWTIYRTGHGSLCQNNLVIFPGKA